MVAPTPSKIRACKLCGMTFAHKSELKAHYKADHPHAMEVPDRSSSAVNGSMEMSEQLVTTTNSYSIEVCIACIVYSCVAGLTFYLAVCCFKIYYSSFQLYRATTVRKFFEYITIIL